MVDRLTQTLFKAPIYKSYGTMIARKKVPFSQDAIPIKDLSLFMKTAERAGVPTPLSGQLLELLNAG